MTKSIILKWAYFVGIVTAVDIVAMLCDPEHFDGLESLSESQRLISLLGSITTLLDLPLLGIRRCFEKNPLRNILLPIPGMGQSDVTIYMVFRMIEDIIICIVIALLIEGCRFLYRWKTSGNGKT